MTAEIVEAVEAADSNDPGRITLVYKFGFRDGTDFPAEAMKQLELAHTFKHELITRFERFQEEKKALWSTYEPIADVEQQLEPLLQRIADLEADAKEHRRNSRRVSLPQYIVHELKECRATVKDLRQRRRDLMHDGGFLAVKDKMSELKSCYDKDLKAMRQAVAARGLYWGTYNAILANHQTATKLLVNKFARGQSASRRHRPFDGTGTLSLQFAHNPGDVFTPDMLAYSWGKWQNVFGASGVDFDAREWNELPRKTRTRLSRDNSLLFSLGTGREPIVLNSLIVHRPLPKDADLRMAQLTRRIHMGRPKITLAITVSVPKPPPAEGATVSLHFGWRRRIDGSVRVATYLSDQPLSPPPPGMDIADAVIQLTSRMGEIVLPGPRLGDFGPISGLHSVREKLFNQVATIVADWLELFPQPQPDEDHPNRVAHPTAETMRLWKQHRRLQDLGELWKKTPPVGNLELSDPQAVALYNDMLPPHGNRLEKITVVDLIACWTRKEIHLWKWEVGARTAATHRRDHLWRNVSAWLNRQAGVLLVDDTDLASLRKSADILEEEDKDIPRVAARVARDRAATSAPGYLRESLRETAMVKGVEVVPVRTAFLTRTHAECGYVAQAHPQYALSNQVTCPGCGQIYDQDYNVVKLMLRQHFEDPEETVPLVAEDEDALFTLVP